MPEAAAWNSGSATVVLRECEVHVWRVPLNRTEAEIREARGTLSADETLRADRFHFQRDRDTFIATRGALRQLLGNYLGRPPAELTFDYGVYGKPSLRRVSKGLAIEFNVSHAHGLAVIAFSLGRQLGVDVEFLRPDIASEEIAERFFSPQEVVELRSLPPTMRTEGFFLCWTRKEAYVKAIGDGLQIPLKSFHVSLTPSEPERLESADSERWKLRSLRPDAAFVGAVAAEGQDWELHCWDWTQESKV